MRAWVRREIAGFSANPRDAAIRLKRLEPLSDSLLGKKTASATQVVERIAELLSASDEVVERIAELLSAPDKVVERVGGTSPGQPSVAQTPPNRKSSGFSQTYTIPTP